MIMFLSSFEGILDTKNRISIPSTFRNTISLSKEKVYLLKSLKYSCLEFHLASKINSLIRSYDEKDFFSKKNDHYKTAILSDLEEVSIDRDGRITLRESHQAFTKISKDIIFIGKGNHFEIWQKNLGENHKISARRKFK